MINFAKKETKKETTQEPYFNSLSIKCFQLFDDVESFINYLSAIKIDMRTYKAKLEGIKKDYNDKVKNDFNVSKVKDDDGQDLKKIYADVIYDLEALRKELKEKYEIYYTISKSSTCLKDGLTKDSSIDIQPLYDLANELLDKIEAAPTDDYTQQQYVIENSYELIYNVLKIETIFKPNQESSRDSKNAMSTLRSRVKKSNIHSFFIAKLIKEECDICQKNEVLDRLHQLEAKGMDSKLLIDYDLLNLLAKNTNEAYLSRLRAKVERTFEEYKQKLEEMEKSATNLRTSQEKYTKQKKVTRKNSLMAMRRIGYIIGSIGLTLFLSIGAGNMLRESRKEYRYIPTEYDLETGTKTVLEDTYRDEDSHDVIVHEEQPWVYNNGILSDNYYKYYIDYYLDESTEITDPEEYLKLIDQVNSNNISKTKEKVVEEPENFGKEDVKYTITIYEKTEDFIYFDEGLDIFVAILSAILLVLIEGLIYDNFFKRTLLGRRGVLADIKESRTSEKEDKEQMQKDTERLRKILKDCKELLSEIKSNPYYSSIYPVETSTIKRESIEQALDKSAPGLKKALRASDYK